MYVGIDLGTTHSAIALFRDNKSELIENIHGEYLTPSVIGLGDDGEWLIGKVAKERLVTHPTQTIAEFKRYMGSEKRFEMGDEVLSPEQLSAMILKSLKEDAERALGQPITEAVISVPAYFNSQQRTATLNAAKIANLNVERLINEPSAAALAYSLQSSEYDEAIYMIVDLGGGTLDISVIEVTDSIIEIHASAGDNYLGGADFTQVIADLVLAHWKLSESELTSEDLSKLNSVSEAAKKQLAKAQQVEINVELNAQHYSYTLTRDKFEKQCAGLIERIRRPIIRALQDADIRTSELNGVILVGGSTRMPLIRSEIAKLSSKIPLSQYQPDLAIVMGTAIQAGLKARNEALSDIIMTDVCPYTLGVEVNNSSNRAEFLPIIERNNTIPISKSKVVYSVHPDQEQVTIRVYQGESFVPKENIYLGEMTVDLPTSPQIEEIVLTYTYDINGVLEVQALIVSTGIKEKFYLQNGKNLTQAQLDEWAAKVESLKTLPKDQEKNIALLNKLKRLFEESLGDKRSYIGKLIMHFTEVLDSHDNNLVDETAHKIIQELHFLAADY